MSGLVEKVTDAVTHLGISGKVDGKVDKRTSGLVLGAIAP